MKTYLQYFIKYQNNDMTYSFHAIPFNPHHLSKHSLTVKEINNIHKDLSFLAPKTVKFGKSNAIENTFYNNHTKVRNQKISA